MSRLTDDDDVFQLANTYALLREKVKTAMGWDDIKTDLWFLTPNPHLGKLRPFKMILIGRAEKLEKWIDGALDGNKLHPTDGGKESKG